MKAKRSSSGKVVRSLLFLLGIAFILQVVVSVTLGVIGTRGTAVITHIRRELGERSESVPNRYAYHISYRFSTADGQVVTSSIRRIGSAVYVKGSGSQRTAVRYFQPLPVFNTLEQDAQLSWGKVVLLAAGTMLIFFSVKTTL